MTALAPVRPLRPLPAPAPTSSVATVSAHPAALAAAFVRLFLEVESGRRSPSQLAPMLSASLFQRLAPVWQRPGPQGRLLRVHGSSVRADRYEAAAVIQRGERVGAVALRLARWPEGWVVEAASRPEDEPEHGTRTMAERAPNGAASLAFGPHAQ